VSGLRGRASPAHTGKREQTFTACKNCVDLKAKAARFASEQTGSVGGGISREGAAMPWKRQTQKSCYAMNWHRLSLRIVLVLRVSRAGGRGFAREKGGSSSNRRRKCLNGRTAPQISRKAAVFNIFKERPGMTLRGHCRERLAAVAYQHQLAAPTTMKGLMVIRVIVRNDTYDAGFFPAIFPVRVSEMSTERFNCSRVGADFHAWQRPTP